MITAKFGGTAVTAQNLHCLKEIVCNHGAVVVSAVGKEHFSDTKTTDLLKRHYLGDDTAWPQIERKYKCLVDVNSVPLDVEKLLYFAFLDSRKNGLDFCLSLGEEMAAKIVSCYLSLPFVDATEAVVFCHGKLQLLQTLNNIKSAFKGVKCGVMGGFYGGDNQVRCTFTRGGSDVTGSLCAVALGHCLYENWTDVSGVFQANPRQICGVKSLPNLSYGQMYKLAKGGAEVLHPDAVKIAERFGVPIKVGNWFNPLSPFTTISNKPFIGGFLSVAEKVVENKFVTTLLVDLPMHTLFERLAMWQRTLVGTSDILGRQFCTPSVQLFRCSVFDGCVKLQSDKSLLKSLYNAFCDM